MSNKHWLSSRWIKATLYTFAGLVILLAVLLSSLSLIARHFALNYLESRKLENVDLANIDIGLFAGKFSLSKLNADKSQQRGIDMQSFDTAFYWRPLFSHAVHIKHISADGTTIKVQQTEDGNFKIGLEPEVARTVEDAVEESSTKRAEPWLITIDKINLQNIQLLLSNPDSSARIAVLFNLTLHNLKVSTVGNANIGQLQINNVRVKANGQQTLAWDSLALSNFEFANEQLTLENLSVTALNLMLKQDAQTSTSTLAILQAFSDPSISLAGDTQEPAAAEQRLDVKFNLALENTKADIQGSANFSLLKINNAELSLQNSKTLAWKQLTLSTFDFKQQSLALNAIEVDGFYAIIHRLDSGEILELSTIEALTARPERIKEKEHMQVPTQELSAPESSSQEQVSQQQTQIAENQLHWKLDKMVFVGDSRFEFSDSAISPQYQKALNIKTLQANTLDSQKPQELAELKVKLESETHEEIAIQGELSVLDEKPNGQLAIDIAHIDLTNATGYAVEAIGHDITSGLFDLHTKATIKDGYLDSTSQVLLNKFRVDVADQEKAARVTSSIQLPLNTALSVIRDNDDVIRLEIPVNGELSDPNFEIQKVVRKALAKSLRSASIAYLQYAFQPWGAALFVGKHLTGAVTAIRFDPITFNPGAAELSGDMQNYLTKVSGLLNEKKGLSITACPVITSTDRESLRAQNQDKDLEILLQQLGKQRLTTVKNHLTEQLKVEPGQIVNCLAKFDAKAIPAVELQL